MNSDILKTVWADTEEGELSFLGVIRFEDDIMFTRGMFPKVWELGSGWIKQGLWLMLSGKQQQVLIGAKTVYRSDTTR